MGKLYNNILALCEAANVSARAMCIGAGVPSNLMTELKKGRKENISTATAQKIADYFGVDVDIVLNGQKEKPADEGELDKKATIINAVDKMDGDEVWEILDELRTRPEMRMLFHSAKGATADQIKAIAQMIDGFKG